MIRTQQQQLQQLQAATGHRVAPPAVDDTSPTSERSMSFSNPNLNSNPNLPPSAMTTPRSPTTALHPRSSMDLARADLQQRQSRTPSRTTSPRLRSTSISGEGGENWSLGGRDESAFYQAETQMMVRENQMLRQRIRELGTSLPMLHPNSSRSLMISPERQVNDLHSNSSITHEPAVPSHLTRTESISDESPAGRPALATSSAGGQAKEE